MRPLHLWMLQADAACANALFTHLSTIATPRPLSLFENEYNAQAAATVRVQNNHWIDATSVEKWRADNPPSGVDTSKCAVYFINWYGRPDFAFHVYARTDSANPGTGYSFGLRRATSKIVAWGGKPPATAGRTTALRRCGTTRTRPAIGTSTTCSRTTTIA